MSRVPNTYKYSTTTKVSDKIHLMMQAMYALYQISCGTEKRHIEKKR